MEALIWSPTGVPGEGGLNGGPPPATAAMSVGREGFEPP